MGRRELPLSGCDAVAVPRVDSSADGLALCRMAWMGLMLFKSMNAPADGLRMSLAIATATATATATAISSANTWDRKRRMMTVRG
jgi:hypothetical protein